MFLWKTATLKQNGGNFVDGSMIFVVSEFDRCH